MAGIHYLIEIPDCPYCNSPRTGRYINANEEQDEYALQMIYLRRGEYIKIKQPWQTEYTAFCIDCGNSWYEILKGRFVSKKEKQEYKTHKGTKKHLQQMSENFIPKSTKKNKNMTMMRLFAPVKHGFGFMAKMMIYEPTIGTVKDLIHMGANTKDVKKPTDNQLTFQDLIDECETKKTDDTNSIAGLHKLK